MRFVTFLLTLLYASILSAASFSTANFSVTASDADVAQQAAELAESKRSELALLWFGKTAPKWNAPCPIKVTIDNSAGSGATSFICNDGEVYGWQMQVAGTRDAVMNDVIPHEVNHTLFASYFRRPLPRWADEGASTTVESENGQSQRRKYLQQVYKSRWFIPFKSLVDIKEYPDEPEFVMSLYAEGHSLTTFLLQQKERKQFIELLSQQPRIGWDESLRVTYGYNGVNELYTDWCKWVDSGAAYSALPVTSNRGPNGEKAAMVVFVTSTCSSCQPIKQAIRDGKFRDYNVYIVYLDDPEAPFADINGNGRADGREVMFGKQFCEQFQSETKHEMELVPIMWIPLTAQYIIGATEIAELVRWTGVIVRRFFNIIFHGKPAIGADPAAVDAEPISPPPEPVLGNADPIVDTEVEEKIDWSDLTIIVAVDTSNPISNAVLPAVRGMITRKLKEASEGRAVLHIIDKHSNPLGYEALVSTSSINPDPVYVLVLAQKQSLGLKGIIAAQVERKFEHQTMPKLREKSLEIIFQRTDPEQYQSILDTLKIKTTPTEPIGWMAIVGYICAAVGGLGMGMAKDKLRAAFGWKKKSVPSTPADEVTLSV